MVAIDASTRARGSIFCTRLSTQEPNFGTHRAGKRAVTGRTHRSGMAGATRVTVLIRSGRVAATRVQTAPPNEFPTRWTGPPPRCSMSWITSAAWPLTVQLASAGGEYPKPGRSRAAQLKTGSWLPGLAWPVAPLSRAIRSVQLLAEPPKPCTQTTCSAGLASVVADPVAGAVRTYTWVSPRLTNSPGHTGIGAIDRLPAKVNRPLRAFKVNQPRVHLKHSNGQFHSPRVPAQGYL